LLKLKTQVFSYPSQKKYFRECVSGILLIRVSCRVANNLQNRKIIILIAVFVKLSKSDIQKILEFTGNYKLPPN